MIPFATRRAIEQVQDGLEPAPKFWPESLTPRVATDAGTSEALTLGWMNVEAQQRALAARHAQQPVCHPDLQPAPSVSRRQAACDDRGIVRRSLRNAGTCLIRRVLVPSLPRHMHWEPHP